ncbi:hypothetical protein BJX70DRAFT_402126 [Aspergillus crustosus]
MNSQIGLVAMLVRFNLDYNTNTHFAAAVRLVHPSSLLAFNPHHMEFLRFETNGLYILLSDHGDTTTFHWGLYLAKSPVAGETFHLVDRANRIDWRYETKPSQNVGSSNKLLLALKIAVLDPVLHVRFETCMLRIPIQASVRFQEPISCRIWVKDALFALDQEGFIKLKQTIDRSYSMLQPMR